MGKQPPPNQPWRRRLLLRRTIVAVACIIVLWSAFRDSRQQKTSTRLHQVDFHSTAKRRLPASLALLLQCLSCNCRTASTSHAEIAARNCCRPRRARRRCCHRCGRLRRSRACSHGHHSCRDSCARQGRCTGAGGATTCSRSGTTRWLHGQSGPGRIPR